MTKKGNKKSLLNSAPSEAPDDESSDLSESYELKARRSLIRGLIEEIETQATDLKIWDNYKPRDPNATFDEMIDEVEDENSDDWQYPNAEILRGKCVALLNYTKALITVLNARMAAGNERNARYLDK